MKDKIKIFQEISFETDFMEWLNGLRACMGKGFFGILPPRTAGYFMLQETKMQQGQAEVPLEFISQYWCSAEKRGIPATAVFNQNTAAFVQYNLGIPIMTAKAVVITAGMRIYYWSTVLYTNSQEG